MAETSQAGPELAMALLRIDVTSRSPFPLPSNRSGGADRRWTYERVDGVAHYAVDPSHWCNAGIVDLGLAPKGDDGLVHFEGDVTMLEPSDGGRGTAIVEMPNRGRRTLFGLHNRAAPIMEPTAEIDPGDGFLLARGFTIAWCGWQWDVPRSPARMGLTAPIADVAGHLQLRLQLHEPTDRVALTDQHTGQLGNHQPIPTADVDDPEATLLVRDGLNGEPSVLPRSSWRFGDATHVELDGGFEPGRIYDLIYTTPSSPVAGAGLLAARDLGRYLKTNEGVDKTLATGQSQCGRFLRTYLHLGLNLGEDGDAAYDGILAHIAGARRGEFNHRYAQPSVQPTPSFGHLFPFADEPQTDPRTAYSAGLLDRQYGRGAVPKVIYTNTSSEYWRGDASLAHTSVVDGSDVDPPSATRHYLLSSTQHGPGVLPIISESIFGSKGGNSFNIVDYTPLLRAAMMNLAGWVEEGIEPPPNAVPSISDGTGATREAVLAKLGSRNGHQPVTLPTMDGLVTMAPLDLGPGAANGVGTYPATVIGESYPCLVSDIDADGNEVAGIAMPDVTVPVATHTGFNPRRADTGAPEQLLDYIGSTVPFTPAEIARRYEGEEAYLARIAEAADQLVLAGYLLPEDVDVCRRIAAKRYRALTEATVSAPASGQ